MPSEYPVMMSVLYNRTSPAYVFLSVVLLGFAMAFFTVWVALMPSQIDLPNGALPAQVGDIEILETDLIEEPEQLGSYAAIQQFRDRQTLIRAQLEQPQVSVRYVMPDGSSREQVFQTRARRLADLPWIFWFQVGVGLVSLLIGGWVISLLRGDWGARMFALTALFVPVFAHPAAIYSARQIALDGSVFRVLSSINALGAVGFGIALVGLFSQYPKPIFRPVWLLVPTIIYGIAIALNFLNIGPESIAGLAVLSQMLIALGLGAIQWFRSRREPLNRAGLRWFILVSLVGCSLFIFLSSAPATLGITDQGYVPQGIAFAFFNIMHVGLALGVLRYKVFNLDRWSYYIWLWLSGMILIFVLDILLIRFLKEQPWVSLGVALLIAGFLYFPMRQLLLKFLLHRRSATLKGRMPDIINAALSPTSREHALRWDALLTGVFSPLAPPEIAVGTVAVPRIDESGLSLLIPGVDGLEPRRLRYAQHGRRLFSPEDLEVAANMVEMHELASDSKRAYERGVILERDRISRDVHDNIGAQLLSALHSREVTRKDDLLRDSLKDLRSIINDGFQAEFLLLEVLADLRTETAQRLEAQGVALHWNSPEITLLGKGPVISFELVNGLRSILREAVSNTLHHSGAGTAWVVVVVTKTRINLQIEDDGRGLPVNEMREGGNGISNIMDRVEVLAGACQIGERAGGKTGTRIEVTVPLNPAAERRKVAE